MGDWDIRGSSFSVPPFAGPGEPAWVVGDDIPPDLVTYYAGFGAQTVIMAQIFRYSATVYNFIALCIQGAVPFLAFGSASATGINEIIAMYRNVSVPTLVLGSGGNSTIDIAAGSFFSIRTGADFSIDGVTAPRGLKGRDSQPANSAAFGLEGVALTTPVINFPRNRVSRVQWEGPLFASVANNTTLRVRKGTLAGANLAEWYVPLAASTLTQSSGACYVANRSAAAISTALVFTITADVGTTQQAASTAAVRVLEVFDMGHTADYANAIQI